MSSSWPESLLSNRIKAIQKLTQGQPLTDKLQEMLDLPEMIDSDLKSVDDTLFQILGMFDNTISILSPNLSNFSKIPHKQTHDMSFINTYDDQRSKESTESVKSVKPIKTKRGCYKRRKNSLEFVRVTSTLIDDGHVWRKYGQKVILNSKHQRHYYRCTHKFDQGCQATKQVQMTDDEPPKYMTTYQGQHTCHNLQRDHQIIVDSPNPREDSVFLSFETNSLIGRKQSCPFSSLTKHKHEEGFSFLSMKNERYSSSDYYPTWDPVTQSSQVPLEPKSMMSVGFDIDREDMVSSEVFSSTCSTHQYEMDDMLGSIDFGDFLSELCSHN